MAGSLTIAIGCPTNSTPVAALIGDPDDRSQLPLRIRQDLYPAKTPDAD